MHRQRLSEGELGAPHMNRGFKALQGPRRRRLMFARKCSACACRSSRSISRIGPAKQLVPKASYAARLFADVLDLTADFRVGRERTVELGRFGLTQRECRSDARGGTRLPEIAE